MTSPEAPSVLLCRGATPVFRQTGFRGVRSTGTGCFVAAVFAATGG